MNIKENYRIQLFTLLACLVLPFYAFACKDAVVLVHGNTATPASWDNTYNYLLSNGYSSSDIYRPDWEIPIPAGKNRAQNTSSVF